MDLRTLLATTLLCALSSNLGVRNGLGVTHTGPGPFFLCWLSLLVHSVHEGSDRLGQGKVSSSVESEEKMNVPFAQHHDISHDVSERPPGSSHSGHF